MNTRELPERKDEAVRHLRNAIFMWWVKVMDFHLLSYTFSSCMGPSEHYSSSSLLLADLFSYLLFFFSMCALSDFSSFGVQFTFCSFFSISITCYSRLGLGWVLKQAWEDLQGYWIEFIPLLTWNIGVSACLDVLKGFVYGPDCSTVPFPHLEEMPNA